MLLRESPSLRSKELGRSLQHLPSRGYLRFMEKEDRCARVLCSRLSWRSLQSLHIRDEFSY